MRRRAAIACVALACRLLVVAAVITLAQPLSLRAQSVATSPATVIERSVDGRVRRPLSVGGDSTGMSAAVGAWVTVHRVAKDSAGPMDSARTDNAGRYRIRWRAFGASDAVYFASVTWNGIAYFTAPLRALRASGDEAEITVFDTTSRTFPLTVRGRHLIVGKVDSTNARTVIEVFELSNDSVHTLVSSDRAAAAPTWSVAIPTDARDVRSSEGEISPDAFRFSAGRVSVFAPLAPGIKQVSFSYKLASSSFPVAYATEHGASVFEILIEDPVGAVVAPGFANVDPVTIEGRNFRRFVAQDVPNGVRVQVDFPAAPSSSRNLYLAGLVVVIGLAMVVVLAVSMQRGKARATAFDSARDPDASSRARDGASRAPFETTSVAAPSLPERLAHEIAALDARHDLYGDGAPDTQLQYERRRSQLREALATALAGSTATP